MEALLSAALSNAVAATLLAVVAAAVSVGFRRPALRHALWLLVLLKLVTPPLVSLPVTWPRAAEPVVEVAEPAPPPAAAEDADAIALILEEDALETLPGFEAVDAVAAPPPAEAVSWAGPLLATWLAGTALCLASAVARGRRFARLLRHGRAAPPWLRAEVAVLARRLGLASPPETLLVPGRVTPMVWAFLGRPRLLLPTRLLDRLDADGRRALLIHELAHLRRRDHWVRPVEALAAALFWWHPVAWWARRALRAAEEECCDAWVVWALPEANRAYALTLVETVDFLSESPLPLPSLASGFGPGDDLKRRVTMIMQGTTPRALSWSGLLGVVALSAFLLPIVPVWGQEKKVEEKRVLVVSPQEKYADVVRRFEGIRLNEGNFDIVVRAEDDKAGDEVKKAQAELERMTAELHKKAAELREMEAKIRQAAEKLKATMAAHGVKEKAADLDREKATRVRAEAMEKLAQAQAQAQKAAAEQERRILVERAKRDEEMAKAKAKAAEDKKEGTRQIIIIEDGKKRVIELAPGAKVIGLEEGKIHVDGTHLKVEPMVMPPLRARLGERVEAGERTAADKRLADLERRLAELMKEIQQLRGDARRPVPPTPPTPPPAKRP